MKALVIGGNGFIGSHLVDRLVELGWEVVVYDIHERRFDGLPKPVHYVLGDIKETYLIREALLGVDIVFHLAWATIHEISNQDPAADVLTNLVPTIHLLEECYRSSVKRVVFISSGGTVYGPSRAAPIPETHPQNPVTGYGITKLAVEKYLYMFKNLYDLDYVILRPSVPYGPRQNPLGRQGAATVFLYRVLKGYPINIWGDGSTTRDYFYISDLAEALILSATKEPTDHFIFNIGGGEEISLNHLISNIETVTGEKAKIVYNQVRNFDAPRISLDTHLAQQELHWHPKVTLIEGIGRTYNWMLSII